MHEDMRCLPTNCFTSRWGAERHGELGCLPRVYERSTQPHSGAQHQSPTATGTAVGRDVAGMAKSAGTPTASVNSESCTMKKGTAKQRRGSNNSCIRFPPPDPVLKLDLKSGQTVTLNNVAATIEEAANGLLEIHNPDFIQQLREVGFAPHCDNTPERLERIVKTIVPFEFQQLFFGGNSGRD